MTETSTKEKKKGYAFGSFSGVFTPSILTILGVIMYLRFGWVLGNLGLFKTLLVVTISTSITFFTALSISELATNMRVGGGGAYYIISRSLGLEAGGAIGIPLFLAQALGISFYIAGFSESVAAFFPEYSIVTIGVVTLLTLAVLAYFSADLALKIQFFILILIILSIASFFTGAVTSQPAAPLLVSENEVPTLGFWAVFAVFFPAVTGIEAGLSMSGDLKNPERSLPKGTLAAIFVSYAVYMAIPIALSRLNISSLELTSNALVLRDVAKWKQLVMIGLWGATLSSALGALLGAPRTLQALAKDAVIPRWVGKGFGKKNDPRIATAAATLIALLGVCLGDLNLIAPLLSMFFLTSYGLLNFSAAVEGFLSSPSWRPKFKVHWLLPAFGALGCLGAMLMINVGATLLATTVSAIVYTLMAKRKMRAYWGDLRYGLLMLLARYSIYKLVGIKPHEKTWRPNILVLSGAPTSRWYLIALADALSHGKGFLTVVAVLSKKDVEGEKLVEMQGTIRKHLEDRSVPAIVKVIARENILRGARAVVESYGFGPLVPNTVLLGASQEIQNPEGYTDIISTAYRLRRNLVIMRESEENPSPAREGRIDIWWRRKGENAGLMLALGYLLMTSPEWKGSKLAIKTIAEDEKDKAEIEELLKKITHQENLDAEVGVYIKNGGSTFEEIHQRSKDASMVFLGLRPPEKEEAPEAYSEYLMNFFETVREFPAVAFVLASEKVNFDAIFQLRSQFR